MDIKNLTDDFGVEVRNFDCSKKIGYNELNLLKKTIQDRHFICFKNQKLDGDTLATFTKNFGKLEAYPEKDKTKGKIEIFNVENLHKGKNDSNESMEFLYIDINPETKIEL